ncbi:hypothetical protein ACIRD2_08770 [Streptomyces sp. NPDC093595]|uniref:DoxX family protein n=1 Tax=Streptomyces sp. NPDC093595 TaxID=3366045 RepID=UPI003822E11C
MFTLTGSAHFVGMREDIVAMVPPALPARGLLVTLTGLAELDCALGSLWPRTARFSAGVLTAMLVVMSPPTCTPPRATCPWWDRLGPRTVMQCVFLAATVTVLLARNERVVTGTSPAPSGRAL